MLIWVAEFYDGFDRSEKVVKNANKYLIHSWWYAKYNKKYRDTFFEIILSSGIEYILIVYRKVKFTEYLLCVLSSRMCAKHIFVCVFSHIKLTSLLWGKCFCIWQIGIWGTGRLSNLSKNTQLLSGTPKIQIQVLVKELTINCINKYILV